MKRLIPSLVCLLFSLSLISQDYFYKDFGPFDSSIPSPEAFLGYEIGDYHTRHDRIVAYLEALAAASDRASLIAPNFGPFWAVFGSSPMLIRWSL